MRWSLSLGPRVNVRSTFGVIDQKAASELGKEHGVVDNALEVSKGGDMPG